MRYQLAIVGSRDYTDYLSFTEHVDKYIAVHQVTAIISGGARGTDTLAQKYALDHNIEFMVFPADWKRYGKSAGPMRNKLIVENCDAVLAFPSKESIGTFDTIRKAQQMDKPVQIINI